MNLVESVFCGPFPDSDSLLVLFLHQLQSKHPNSTSRPSLICFLGSLLSLHSALLRPEASAFLLHPPLPSTSTWNVSLKIPPLNSFWATSSRKQTCLSGPEGTFLPLACMHGFLLLLVLAVFLIISQVRMGDLGLRTEPSLCA